MSELLSPLLFVLGAIKIQNKDLIVQKLYYIKHKMLAMLVMPCDWHSGLRTAGWLGLCANSDVTWCAYSKSKMHFVVKLTVLYFKMGENNASPSPTF